jgi:hypothetical protein
MGTDIQKVPSRKLAANTNKIISPSMFLLNRVESDKDDSSLEAHIQSSQTSRGSYFDKELFIFVKIFEFLLVTLSL